MISPILIALLALFFWDLGITSEPPSPSAFKSAQQKQRHAANPDSKTTASNYDSNATISPVITRTETQGAEKHGASNSTNGDKKPSEDRTLEIIFIGITALATVVLAIFTIDEINEIRTGSMKLYCFSYVDYLDENIPAIPRKTSCCRVLQPTPGISFSQINGFFVRAESEHEYAD